MGAGHDGAAKELAARLQSDGHTAVVRDFLDAGPLRVGTLLKHGYEFELRHVPSAYDATYRLWYRVPWMAPAVSWLVAALTRRRLMRWIRLLDADVVVSTYPLATLCLGRLRRRGTLRIPAVNFITDFGVHPLWVHRGIDLNLAVHDGPAKVAFERTGKPSVACGPLVSTAYGPDGATAPGARSVARQRWGLGDDERAVLVVAGSWGVGSIRETFEAIAGDGRFTPVVVCGRDDGVRQQIESAVAATSTSRSIVIGWTDEMPSLMAACDALVENAGGLTSLEAMRAGLPVVSFRPIAGHGVENTATMAEMGVSRLAGSISELLAALDTLCAPGPQRDAQVEAAQGMFVADGAALVVAAADVPVVRVHPVRRTARLAVRAATGTAAVMALAWTGLTTGVSVATAAGAGVAHPVAGARGVAYVGVRLSSAELADRSIRTRLESLGVTVVVDEQTAGGDPGAVQDLAAQGMDLANGGRGWIHAANGSLEHPAQWNRAQADVDAGHYLSALIGRPVNEFVPGRRVDAFDLFDSGAAHSEVVVPDEVWSTAMDLGDDRLSSDKIYLLNGLHSTPAQLSELIGHLSDELTANHLVAVPFNALQ
jgi:UDP-N-acetylglucosamine:LPS N-acetylglucosamine transferase